MMNRIPVMMHPRVKIEKKNILDDLISDTEDTTDDDISDNEDTTNVVKIQNMTDNSIHHFDNIVHANNCWKIRFMDLCHCGRFHYHNSRGEHEIIELTTKKDMIIDNNTSMRSVVTFFIKELLNELRYQNKLKQKTINALDKNNNKKIIEDLKEEIDDINMKIEIHKEVLLKN